MPQIETNKFENCDYSNSKHTLKQYVAKLFVFSEAVNDLFTKSVNIIPPCLQGYWQCTS